MTTSTHWCVAPSSEVLGLIHDLVDPRSLMSAAELGRQAARVRQSDRDDFVAARVLARVMLARRAGVPVDAQGLRTIAIRQTCPVCGGPHGRPEIPGMPGLGLSWAHSHGWVAAAVGPGAVGIDVEPSSRWPSTAGRPGPQALAWVRAEALVKSGHGDLDRARTWTLSAGPAPQGRRYRLPATGSPREARWPPVSWAPVSWAPVSWAPVLWAPVSWGRTAVLTDIVLPGIVGAVCAGSPATGVDVRGSALGAR